MTVLSFTSDTLSENRADGTAAGSNGVPKKYRGGIPAMKEMFVVFLAIGLLGIMFTDVHAAGLQEVEQSFRSFCRKRIQSLQSTLAKRVARNEKNAYTAFYTAYSPEYSVEVQKTDSQTSPYIGILKYTEKSYSRSATTRAEAFEGPFTCQSVCPVTEIFVYSKGKWLH